MSLALARKYRPRRFADVAVQSHVATTLRNAIGSDRLGHAYLFCGPRGTGKTTLARVLAMALNCEQKRPDHEPCGECPSCQRIWSGGASLDVIEMDAASNRGVDDARELRERAMYAPSGDDRHKIYILDEAHMLTREAWNTLLKVLEEPPPRVIFVFATTDPQKIQQAAAPVLSRVQRFDLRRIGPAEVRERLRTVLAAEGITAEPEALAMLARAADGSMRDALSLTDQALSLGGDTLTAERVRESLGLVHEEEHLRLLALVAQRQAGEVFSAVARLADHGVDFSILLTDFANILRAQLAVVLGGTLPDLSERVRDALAARTGDFSAGDLLRMLHLVSELEPHMRRSGQQQLLFETLLVRCALLDRTLDLEQVLRGVSESGGAPRAAAAPAAPAAPASRRAAPPSSTTALRASAPATTPIPVVADRAEATPGPRIPLDLNRLVERWESITDAVHGEHGALMLSSTLAHATPSAVTASGTVTLTVTSEAHAELISGGTATVLAAIRQRFDGVQTVAVRVEAPEADRAPRRLNEGAVKADRMAMLRKQSPLLDAAVEALDLELLD
ncbi:MAG: DNA polymerase III subunit gamma/tau [Gemmatimonadota bacterium]|jgi:DNA polymerase-3 subunit gamma/tau|nr:DNA polymerase III subunit gamma/tau [Gemmatimonadota bacterium]MDQ8152735.1 DNA polymerase III subunit gamma/tau [Gemmatimonadota bacterium]MDQ8175509.1 DNA polymerase III subunit gamma/tau [Gemmatimonadota bacterium]MDQ8178575.1 DNA polymerase III subunit gamma/tau [Gemmatimonadota bacterium]